MARRPRRVRLVCHVSWHTNRVMGRRILADVTAQPVPDYCGAHAAVESFQSRATILDAELGLSFPTLSILHLIDLIKDDEARATTLVEKREVKDNEYAFKLLKSNGVVSKEDYDAAPPSEHGFTKNVQGLKHYRIEDYRLCRLKKSPFAEGTHEDKEPMIPMAVNQIADEGPLYGWFALDDSFYSARHEIYRAPSVKVVGGDDVRLRTHALLLFGFGTSGRTRRSPATSVFLYQNNWGVHSHIRGRGVMEAKVIMGVIAPLVVRNWD